MLEKIRQILSEQFNCEPDSIDENTNFKDDLGADSLDLFELVMGLEEGQHSGAALSRLLLLLRLRALALLVARVQRGGQLGGLGGQLVIDVSFDNSLVELTDSHGILLSFNGAMVATLLFFSVPFPLGQLYITILFGKCQRDELD